MPRQHPCPLCRRLTAGTATEDGLRWNVCQDCLASPVQNMTWAGYELLDAIRADSSWNRIGALAKEKGLDLSEEVIHAIARRLLPNHPADLPPGFTFEPYPVCPRCGWNLRQQQEEPKTDQPVIDRTPKSYRPAKWRCTLPADLDGLGVAFDTAEGTPIRLRLDLESARHLRQSLAEKLRNYERTTSHSDRSAGMSSEPGSTPDEGVNV